MASIALEVLMLGGSMLLSMFPIFGTGETSQNPDATTYVRIAAGVLGKNVNPTTPGQGSIPGVAIFDVNGDLIGKKERGGHMQSNKMIPIEALPDVVNSIPEYLSVSSGDDAICIAFITVTAPSGVAHTWNGDIARACNISYYISNNEYSKESPYTPACMWLKGRSNFAQDGAAFKGMAIHLPDFSSRNEGNSTADFYKKNMGELCNTTPRFWGYQELSPNDMMPYFSPPIGGINTYIKSGKTGPAPWKINPPVKEVVEEGPFKEWISARDIAKRNTVNEMKMNGTLIITPLPGHHAQELCDDEHSLGPDFVSLSDNMYCDMDHKKAYPLCSEKGKDKHACFDLKTSTLRPGTRKNGKHPHRRDEELPEKGYHDIVNW